MSLFTNGRKATHSFDIVAPGEKIFSARNPGSNIDNSFPTARTDEEIFRGFRHVAGRRDDLGRGGPAGAGPPDADAGPGQEDPRQQRHPAGRP